MEARLNMLEQPAVSKAIKHVMAMGKEMKASPIPDTTKELVALRVSQINGCGVCVDMHTKDAMHNGESVTRLNMVAAWREATVFTEAERAALELAEQGTRIADAAGGVPDPIWSNAAKHYDDDELASLVLMISVMNLVNRLNVIVQQPVGDYQPGQF